MGGPSSIRNIHTRELRRIRRDILQRKTEVGTLSPKLDRTLLRINRELERRVRPVSGKIARSQEGATDDISNEEDVRSSLTVAAEAKEANAGLGQLLCSVVSLRGIPSIDR